MPDNTVSNVFTILGTLALIILIFVGAYWFTKLVGRHYGGRTAGQTSSMKVLERMVLGADSSLVIVRVKDKVLLLGIKQQRVTLLQELDAEQYPDEGPAATANGKGAQFTEIFKNSLRSFGVPLSNKQDKRGKGS